VLNSAGFAAASVALLALPGTTSLNGTVAVACCAMGALALARGGYSVNHMDIAPRHAGVLMGVSNGAGSMAGMIGPWVTGRILERAASTAASWHTACAVPAGLCTLGALVYAAFGTGERLFD
jgi:ACS family sodium-dependent inorganic phosphate cotransporter